MPRRTDDGHGGESRSRTSWRIDRLRKMHELGRAFGLTDDAKYPPEVEIDERDPNRPVSEPSTPTT
jgi:hypothetical protein